MFVDSAVTRRVKDRVLPDSDAVNEDEAMTLMVWDVQSIVCRRRSARNQSDSRDGLIACSTTVSEEVTIKGVNLLSSTIMHESGCDIVSEMSDAR